LTGSFSILLVATFLTPIGTARGMTFLQKKYKSNPPNPWHQVVEIPQKLARVLLFG
jgi:hypothetical protein